MKFLKKFKTDADYQTYKEGESYVTPNVSLVTENNGIHYHPYVPPVPITYYATDKLVETTATDSTAGLHINAFNSPMVSHEFADGVGTITFEEDITSIGNYAFYNCSGLTGITIPDSVTTIGSSAFAYCSGLTEITCHAIVAPSIQSGTFQSVKSGGTLYVPAGASGYDAWMGTGDYYLGKYNWTIQEIS